MPMKAKAAGGAVNRGRPRQAKPSSATLRPAAPGKIPRTGPAAEAAAALRSRPKPVTPSARRSEEAVYEAILRALLAGRLRPGTPLRERLLAETFGTTRGAVRKVLARLGAEGKLVLHHNRGAYVPEPSDDDMHGVYDARKALEAGIVALLAGRVERPQLAAMEKLLAAERLAQREGRRDDAVALAGDFHLLLADCLGNPQLSTMLRSLVARTQLFVALFESSTLAACSLDEHDAILQALRRRDAGAALAAMIEHLDCVEERVLQHSARNRQTDVAAILRGAIGDT